MKDQLFAQPHERLDAFQFDESVVAVFPDMIQRSVPGYQTILTGIGELTERFCQPQSHLYDLGCSLGAASILMRKRAKAGCRLIAVDNSEAMIQQAKAHILGFHSDIPVDLLCKDMTTVPIENASVVVINFTLQFIEPERRQALLKTIYDGLNPGGILILSEKLHFEDDRLQSAIEHMHLQFKRANGYSELEISQKRASLDNVLITDSEAEHLDRLASVGFSSAAIWFQAYNFASFLAIKPCDQI